MYSHTGPAATRLLVRFVAFTLLDGVRHFQHRHGLDADGVIGPATRAQLRVPLGDRVRQIELTLERWR